MVRFSEAPDGSGSAAAPIWPPPHGPLTGDVVELVPLRAEHEQPLFEASEGQAELWRWLRGTPPDRQEFAAYFAQAQDGAVGLLAPGRRTVPSRAMSWSSCRCAATAVGSL